MLKMDLRKRLRKRLKKNRKKILFQNLVLSQSFCRMSETISRSAETVRSSLQYTEIRRLATVITTLLALSGWKNWHMILTETQGLLSMR